MGRVQATSATRSLLGFGPLIALALGAALLAGPLTRDPVFERAAQVGADPSAAPEERLEAAADVIDAADDPDGSGYRFRIVQTSTLVAKPDGPRIEVPHPTDPGQSLGFADTYQLDTVVEHGVVLPDGFWMEMRDGPAEGKAPDFEAATYRYGTLVRDGVTWRNDGEGWYETDRPPGIGLDPATVALLPRLLRRATEAKDEGTIAPAEVGPRAPGASEAPTADPTEGVEPAAGGELRLVSAKGEVAHIPGVIAVDGEPFTELTKPIDFALDDQGRLVTLRVLARNTTVEAFDLVVETLIELDWTSEVGALPEANPRWDGADELQVVP